MQKISVRLKQGQTSIMQSHIVAQTRNWFNSCILYEITVIKHKYMLWEKSYTQESIFLDQS